MRKGLAALLLATACSTAPLQQVLEQYEEVYCLRVAITINQGEAGYKTLKGHGTAFVVASGEETILATNKHVINVPKKISGYEVTGVEYWLVDNESDNHPMDDIPVRLVAVGESDLALLVHDGELPGGVKSWCDPVLGAQSYIVGYPSATARVVDEGIVSNLGVMYDEWEYFFSSNDTIPGMSGSPAYTTNDTGDICLYGVVSGMTQESGYGIIVPSSDLEDLLWDYYGQQTNNASH